MNDKDLWPIHIIVFGYTIALVLYAIKLIFMGFLWNPIMLLIAMVVALGIWMVPKSK